MSRIRVVSTFEGTYPYETGGVSTWADILIHKLKNVDFILLPIMMHPYIKLKFELPTNVTDIITVPLWGSEEPTEYIRDINFSEIYIGKLNTRESNIVEEFIPILRLLLAHIYKEENNLDKLGNALLEFHEYFHKNDYYETFRHESVWLTYKEFVLNHYSESEKQDLPSMYDLVEGLRFLYRFFISILPVLPDVDIYHSSGAAFCGLPCIIAKLKHGSKFLLTEHGVYLREQYLYASREQMPAQTKEFLMGMIDTVVRLNYHFADVITPVCNYNKRWELKNGASPEKIETVYNGIDTDIFRNYGNAANTRPTVVMVARIDQLKDIETYIRCAKKVADSIPSVLFKLYGPKIDEKYYDFCEDLVKELSLNQNFEFSGVTSNPAAAYNEGDVVMLTSISEAFPFVVIEAMACEKVVVSSDVGGTKEVLEGFGYVIKPKDVDGFSNAVIEVLNDKNMSLEMGVDARTSILNGFMIEDMVDSYDALYKRLYNANRKK